MKTAVAGSKKGKVKKGKVKKEKKKKEEEEEEEKEKEDKEEKHEEEEEEEKHEEEEEEETPLQFKFLIKIDCLKPPFPFKHCAYGRICLNLCHLH